MKPGRPSQFVFGSTAGIPLLDTHNSSALYTQRGEILYVNNYIKYNAMTSHITNKQTNQKTELLHNLARSYGIYMA